MSQEAPIKFTIDGIEVEAEKGQMVLEVAAKYGIKIPTLCYHKALPGYSACRLCMVEVQRGERKKLTAACTYPAQDGIDVKTNSDDVIRIRKLIIESLMAQAPGSEEIKNMAKELGVEETRFTINEDENNKCILCGLCVRICNQRIGAGAIGFMNRGSLITVLPAEPVQRFAPQMQ
jgi:NADH dehydrogenase/NADH:ubiquinone oxidoreductase subunit G